MKTIKLLLVMLLITITNYGQARIGSTIKEIKTEYQKLSDYEIKEHINKETKNPYLTVTNNTNFVIYLFNQGKGCSETLIRPFKSGTLQAYIEKYNASYVIINNKHWKYYTKNGIMEVYLKKTDENIYYFDWMMTK